MAGWWWLAGGGGWLVDGGWLVGGVGTGTVRWTADCIVKGGVGLVKYGPL